MIAQGLSGFSPASAALEAGRIMLNRLDELAQARVDFAFESTLAGRSVRGRLLDLIARGYAVHLFYLWLPSPVMAVERVRHRVKAGGHDVPEVVIRRRFWRSLVNFDHLFRPIVTSWQLLDASRLPERPLVAQGGESARTTIIDEDTWNRVRRQIEEHS